MLLRLDSAQVTSFLYVQALDADLREYLQQVTGSKIIATQVHEIARWIRVKGLYAEHICAFMLKKGF